jgi:DNA phosphorothioation-dependent restriction protein DptH
MSVGLRELRVHELNVELERVLVPRLAALLRARESGHCMRVSDLDLEIMVHLCQQLRAQVPGTQVYVLADSRRGSIPPDLTVTSTKLVELRNSLADNTFRPPLLVFIPGDMRAAAEDSFGIATFEEVALGDVYGQLEKLLLAEVPNGLRPTIAEVLRRIEAAQWPFADSVAVARYLLTLKLNNFDRDAAGAALFELGLIPDFELLTDSARASLRVTRNLKKVRTLIWSSKSERGRVVELGLSERAFRTQLANFLAEVGLEEPKSWTRGIVIERENWKFSFHRWKFDEDEVQPGAILIEVVETSLPKVGDEEDDEKLSRLIGQQYLPVGKKGLKQFSVMFRVDPHPAKVQGLARFSAQVVSQDGGLVGLAKNVAAWKSSKDRATVTFTKLGRIDWEEGWHFVRLQPLTADGDPIPLLDERGEPLLPLGTNDEIRRPNESDLFYVVPEGEIDEPPPQRAMPHDDSLVHAWKRMQFTALLDKRNPADVMPQEVRWMERTERGRVSGMEFIQARFGREGVIHIPVSRQLKVLEQKILMTPGGAVSWRLPIRFGQAGESVSDAAAWPQDQPTQSHLSARARYFAALRAAGKELVTQAADPRQLRSFIVEYAEAYEALVAHLLQRAEAASETESHRTLLALRQVLALDTITLDIINHKGERREAALIAPTHPLRALWLSTWAEVAEAWLHQAASGTLEHVIPTRDAILKTLVPLSCPPVLPRGTGQLFTAVDNLTPFWTLYAPTNEEDLRGLVGDVCAALGLPESGIGGATITGAYLASRVERYLVQHPYVQTLVMNAFNVGRANILADMLLELQKQPAFADLRYDLRLFVPDPDAPGVGEALTDLLSPSSSVTGQEADAFSAIGESHLYPKLGLAIRSVTEFEENPDRHMAHLTFLFDVFPAKEISAVRGEETVGIAPVHGLFQDFTVEYTEDEHTVAWQRWPQHGPALELLGAEELTDILTSLPILLSTAVASVATGQAGLKRVPLVTLALDAQDRSLIHHVHEVSDWVITVDRNMGIEFFDHGGKPGRPDYLIDHSPDMTSDFGHRLFITSRSLQELQVMLEPALIQYGIQVDQGHAAVLLHQIRSLAGRLALKLISSPAQRSEVLGLALARIYLDYQGVFKNQILVPLDAHLELYHILKGYAEEVGDEVSFKRTDLALFDLDAAARIITCRLVEVKCYSGVGDFGAYNQLKGHIAEQIAQSEQVLAHHFDPHRTTKDRPDRLLKTRELIALLEFYLNRSMRYQLFDSDAAGEARTLLTTLVLRFINNA